MLTTLCDRLRWNILKFERDYITLFGKALNRLCIVELTDNRCVSDLSRRSIRVVAKNDDTETHARCGDGEHSPELTTAHHANRGSRLDHWGSFVFHFYFRLLELP